MAMIAAESTVRTAKKTSSAAEHATKAANEVRKALVELQSLADDEDESRRVSTELLKGWMTVGRRLAKEREEQQEQGGGMAYMVVCGARERSKDRDVAGESCAPHSMEEDGYVCAYVKV